MQLPQEVVKVVDDVTQLTLSCAKKVASGKLAHQRATAISGLVGKTLTAQRLKLDYNKFYRTLESEGADNKKSGKLKSA